MAENIEGGLDVSLEEYRIISGAVPINKVLIRGTRTVDLNSEYLSEVKEFLEWYRNGGAERMESAYRIRRTEITD